MFGFFTNSCKSDIITIMKLRCQPGTLFYNKIFLNINVQMCKKVQQRFRNSVGTKSLFQRYNYWTVYSLILVMRVQGSSMNWKWVVTNAMKSSHLTTYQ